MKKVNESFDHISPENQAMRLAHRYNALVDAYEDLERRYEELKKEEPVKKSKKAEPKDEDK